VVAHSDTGDEAAVCSKARDEVAACSRVMIEDGSVAVSRVIEERALGGFKKNTTCCERECGTEILGHEHLM
jgi:hypothetical protein